MKNVFDTLDIDSEKLVTARNIIIGKLKLEKIPSLADDKTLLRICTHFSEKSGLQKISEMDDVIYGAISTHRLAGMELITKGNLYPLQALEDSKVESVLAKDVRRIDSHDARVLVDGGATPLLAEILVARSIMAVKGLALLPDMRSVQVIVPEAADEVFRDAGRIARRSMNFTQDLKRLVERYKGFVK